MIGETISHYKILEKLGEGGMGVVYKAEDTKLNRTVALKFLPPEVTRFPEARARFLHEAQAAAALNHPNICTIHDVEDVEGRVFLAMEHIEGESLADRIARGPVKIEDAVAIGVATAEGLSAAHSRGIVHRDIKPGNVMLTRDGRVKILDFGLAVAPELTRLTREGRTTGTISYMSPEQSRGGDVDHRTDIWSLGVVLYEMVTGRRPFAGEHEQAVLLSIIHDEPDAPTGLRTGVPPELERIIAKAMAKDPGDRYQHVDDMIVDLRGVARSRTAETATAATSGTRTAPSARRRRRGRASALAAAAIVVAVLAVAWIILKSPWRGSPETMPAGPDRILVAAFDNRSGDPSLDYLSDSLVTSISEGLAQMGLVEVVPQSHAAAGSGDTAERVRQPDTGRLLESAREAGASVLVVGSFHVRMDSLRIEARVLDASDGKAINVIPHEDGPLATPSVAIDRIRSRVMGSLAARADPTLGRYARSHAPSYEAYREYESGMKDFGARTPVALAHFNRAIELDAEFVDPWIFKVAALASLDRFAEADSLIQDLRSRRGTLPPHLRLYLDTFEARLRGEDEEALRNVREIVRIAPSHFMSRRFLAVIALRLNRPREAIANLERLQTEQPETDLYIESWTYGGLANAYHMLGEYQRELQILETAAEKFPDMLWLRSRQARALAALGRIEDIERLIEDTSASPAGHGSVGLILLAAADELRAHGHPEAAEDFAEQAVRWYRTNLESEGASEPSRNLLGHALYSAEQWDEAREVFGGLAREHSDNIDYAGYLGALAARAGETETADAIRESLLAIDEPYDFGMNTYWGACISAQLGRKDEAMELLRRSYAEGAGLGLHVHQDVDLEPLSDHPPFKRFIAPRG